MAEAGVSGWDETKKLHDQSSGGKFLKFQQDGDSAVGMFCGVPFGDKYVFDEKLEVYEVFDEAKHGATARWTARFSVNFLTLAEKGKKLDVPAMKIIEMSNPSYSNVLTAKGKYGVDEMVYEVKRSGAKGDQKTVLHVMPEVAPDSPYRFRPEYAALLKSTALHDLKKARDERGGSEATQANGASANGSATPSDPPIAEATRAAFVERLQRANAENPKAVETFTEWMRKVCGVAKVKELRLSHAAAADAEIKKLEPQPKPSPAAASIFE